MDEDKQKLNDNKTEVLFDTKQQMEKLKENDTFEIKICSEIIKQSPSARNIGFTWNPNLSQTCIAKVYSERCNKDL